MMPPRVDDPEFLIAEYLLTNIGANPKTMAARKIEKESASRSPNVGRSPVWKAFIADCEANRTVEVHTQQLTRAMLVRGPKPRPREKLK